jgi:hypothetical protein
MREIQQQPAQVYFFFKFLFYQLHVDSS